MKLLILKQEFNNHVSKLLSLGIEDNRILSIQADDLVSSNLVGNIYIGKVKNVVKNIDACFVEIAKKELCFLAFSDCVNPLILNRTYDGRILEGDEMVVQVIREAIKTKQPALSTKLSISGKYCVISMGNKHLGISNKMPSLKKDALLSFLNENSLIDHTRNCVQSENIPSPYSFVIRTNVATLDDFSPVVEEWTSLTAKLANLLEITRHRTCFSVLYKEIPGYVKYIRDFYDASYDEIVTDEREVYDNLIEYGIKKPLRFYQDELISLSNLYGITTKVKDLLGSRVWLKSGGYLVIEPTEALTVIDVNTGKYIDSKKNGDTFKLINFEAATEIALQLKLRNLSGIIIIDFINMDKADNEELLNYLTRLVKKDHVPTDVVDITPLGLVEITRKKVNRPLREQLQ